MRPLRRSACCCSPIWPDNRSRSDGPRQPGLPAIPARISLSGKCAFDARTLGYHGERAVHPEDIVPVIGCGIEATLAGQPALVELITAQETRVSRL